MVLQFFYQNYLQNCLNKFNFIFWQKDDFCIAFSVSFAAKKNLRLKKGSFLLTDFQ